MEIVFTDIVAVLSFPAGLLSGYLLFGFHDLIENSALPEILGGGSGVYWIYAVSAWSLFLILGYLQWFLILPYAARKLLRFWERRRLGT